MTFISGKVDEGGKEFFSDIKRGAKSFFRGEKGGRELFFGEKRGAKSFFRKKKGGLRLFLRVGNPQNPARVPYKFWSVPKSHRCIIMAH